MLALLRPHPPRPPARALRPREAPLARLTETPAPETWGAACVVVVASPVCAEQACGRRAPRRLPIRRLGSERVRRVRVSLHAERAARRAGEHRHSTAGGESMTPAADGMASGERSRPGPAREDTARTLRHTRTSPGRGPARDRAVSEVIADARGVGDVRAATRAVAVTRTITRRPARADHARAAEHQRGALPAPARRRCWSANRAPRRARRRRSLRLGPGVEAGRFQDGDLAAILAHQAAGT
jgi:hypothetical protein